MDRIINVKVGGNFISKDSKNAGVRGEANVTMLRITFDDGWIKDDYAKKITFWDARGLNPVVIDLLPTLAVDDRTYLVPIPKEPLAEAGKLTFVIEGEIEGKVQRSISDTLEVKDSPTAENAGQPVPPTPDELTQIRGSFEEVKGDVLNAVAAKEKAEQYANQTAADRAKVEAATKTPPKIVDGYWYVWDYDSESYKYTGVRAQAGSEVYVGENPPAEADVWINPNSEDDGRLATVDYVEARLLELSNKVAPSPASVTLYEDRWERVENEKRWYQEVEVENASITEYSKVDLQLDADQIMEFYESGLILVAENEDGKVTVFSIGNVPESDVTIHAKVSEVVVNG